MRKPRPIVDRFWEKVLKLPGDTACWEWQAGLSKGGYGQFWDCSFGCNRIASRVSYELNIGVIPDGLDVLHTCDNRKCVRPDHLFLGTHLYNMQDMKEKGRERHPSGENHGRAKLTDAQVTEIRDWLKACVGRSWLARKYNVSPTQIGKIAGNLQRKRTLT